MNIGFIGAGKVGFSLGKYFKENGLTVTGYFSRNIDSAKCAAEFTKTKLYPTLEELTKESDIIFVTVSDGAIKKVYHDIKKLSIKNKIICHCSGSLPSAVFSGIEDYQAYGYSIHPLFAISDKLNSYKELSNAIFTIEGNKKYIGKLTDMIVSLGNKVKTIEAHQKDKYHVAAVMVSNQINALMAIGTELLIECGFSEETAFEALCPLMTYHTKNIAVYGTEESLTGPIERGDAATVARHMSCLNGDVREIYQLLSRKLVEIAKKKNPDTHYEKTIKELNI